MGIKYTIPVLLFLLMSSIGYSGWYSYNMVLNPDFSIISNYSENFSESWKINANPLLWTIYDPIAKNVKLYTPKIDEVWRATGLQGQTLSNDLVNGATYYYNITLSNSTYWALQFDYNPTNFTMANTSGGMTIYISNCPEQVPGDCEEMVSNNSVYPIAWRQINWTTTPSITELGDGWKRFYATLIFTNPANLTNIRFVITEALAPAETLIDNVYFGPVPYYTCQGYECPNIVRTILQNMPLLFGIAILAIVVMALTGVFDLAVIIGLFLTCLLGAIFVSILATMV